jgi:hypothetical protein
MAYGRLGDVRGWIEGGESSSYSDDDIYISDYPEEIKKDVRKIVSVVDNNKERMAERQIEGISDNNNERIHSLKNKGRMLCLPNSYNISIGNNQKTAG